MNNAPQSNLPWYDLIWVNLYWLGLNMRNNALNLFLPYLVLSFAATDVQNTAYGAVRTSGLIIAMLVQPAVGLLSDRSTSHFGRRRPFIFIGVLLDLVFLAAIYFAWDFVSLLVAGLLIQFSGNLSHGALQGLIPDLVPEKQRGAASGIKALMELLPVVIVGMVIARLVGAGHLDWAFYATGGALLVVMLLTMWLVKEKPLVTSPDVPFWQPMVRVLGVLAGILLGGAAGLVGGGIIGGLAGLVAWPLAGAEAAKAVAVGVGGAIAMLIAVVAGVWAGVFSSLGAEARSNANFTWWVVNRLFFLAAITSIQAYAAYFIMHAFSITREAATTRTGTLMTVVGIFTLLSALPGGWLSDRFGHRRMVALSGAGAVVGTAVLLLTIKFPHMGVLYVAGVILGLATGLFTATNWALGTALAPSAQAGRYLGISNLAGAGAGIVGTGIGGPLADTLNAYLPGLGYVAIFACYGLLFVGSVVALKWIRMAGQPG